VSAVQSSAACPVSVLGLRSLNLSPEPRVSTGLGAASGCSGLWRIRLLGSGLFAGRKCGVRTHRCRGNHHARCFVSGTLVSALVARRGLRCARRSHLCVRTDFCRILVRSARRRLKYGYFFRRHARRCSASVCCSPWRDVIPLIRWFHSVIRWAGSQTCRFRRWPLFCVAHRRVSLSSWRRH